MGRKLTSWERSQRDRERERKRVARAKEVAARRKKARAEKEKKIKGNIAAAEKEVAKYEKFYDSLVTLHLHPFAKSTFNNKFSKVLEFSTNIKKPKKPNPYKFKPSDELKNLKNESEYNFKKYCNAEGKSSFILFVKLFGTEKKYETYKKQKKQQYDKHKKKEEKRKIAEQKEYDDVVFTFESKLKDYDTKLANQKEKFASDEELRIKWYEKILNGDSKTMEEACELMFPIEFSLNDEYEMLNPTEASVGYNLVNQDKVQICVNLPAELNFLPKLGLKMTPSGKSMSEFKISNKIRTEVADRVVCSLGFGYLKSIFNVLKKVNNVSIEVGVDGIDPKTGGSADLIFLLMEVSRNAYNKIKLENVDVIHAVENFDHKYRSTNTKKNIEGKIDREDLIWATDDDKNIKLCEHIRDSFRSSYYS